MKKNLSFKIEDLPISNPVQERIKLFYDRNLLVHEIAALTDLRKKDIKRITKGKYVPVGKEQNRLLKIFDEAIARLHYGNEATIYDGACPEPDLDTEGKTMYKLDVTSVTIYKGTDDKKMIIHIYGDILTP